MINVVVLSLDCVRPEALSCYPESFRYLHTAPYSADTPHIDAIAADGLVFSRAFCQAPFTPASHASLFTGTNPYRHGIRGMFDYKLDADLPTLAEVFSDAGYATGGFIGAHALSSQYGLARGFDTYDEEFKAASENWMVGNRRPGTEVTDRALAWLDDRDGPYLLFAHYFDAHDGGDTSPERRKAGDTDEETTGALRSLYNSHLRDLDEAAGAPFKRLYRVAQSLDPDNRYGRRYHLQQTHRIDEQIGRLVETLKHRGEYDETAIVVLADHGDAFGEHGEYGHREYVYDSTIRVPMIVKPPTSSGVPRGTHSGVVRSVDVYPTLTNEAGISGPPVDGESLYHVASGEAEDRMAYAETRLEESPSERDNLVSDLVCLRGRRWKLIRDELTGSLKLYDVETDPNEQHDLSDDRSGVREDLLAELDSMLAQAPDKDETLLTAEEQAAVEENLEGLGYL